MRYVLLLAAFTLAAAGTRTWTVGPAIFYPGPANAFDSVAVKDPSIVHHENRWHLFYTARNRTDYTLGYASAAKLEELQQAPHHSLSQLHASRSKYAAAPQVFYFRPHKKWYLLFQTTDSNYLPVYSTSSVIHDPRSWSQAQPLLDKKDKGKWIDFWIICDDRLAYLFFTREHRDVVVLTTKLSDFPHGFSNPRTVFSPVHEAVHIYAVQNAAPRYIMIYEQRDGEQRRFGLARATTPIGPWKTVDEHFASGARLQHGPDVTRWTEEVSHGELLRAGSDERLEVSANRWDLLIQGLRQEEHHGEYTLLPWRLGLITASPAPWLNP